jgi:hypothetical protein
MYTQFKTVKGSQQSEAGTGNEKDIRSRQIDELVRQSEDAKRDVYGPNWPEDVKNFYNLFDRTRRMPTFRPLIKAPQLQLLLLQEAAEATDTNIRVFIHKGSERDKEKEKAFQFQWKKNFWNMQTLMGQIYAQFGGTSFLQAGYDPYAKQGRGEVWLRPRMMSSIHVDPISPWPEDWTWMVTEDPIYLDQAQREFFHAESIRQKGAKAESLAGGPAGPLELPQGPMSVTVRGLPSGDNDPITGPLKRRTAYLRDVSVRSPNQQEVAKFQEMKIPVPESVPVFPRGRMIVDIEGTIVVDGDSWLPLGDMWPAYPIWAIPPWDTVWSPAPMKYTKSLQDAAEQQMTNTYENARRLNQGWVIINEQTGLAANTVGGLPGEIVVIAANSPPGAVEVKFPPPFPAQMITLPQAWLALQKELRGQTPARSGNLNPGNVGPDLFEAAVGQSQAGTRLTARLYAWSIQKVVELLFYTMSISYSEDKTIRSGKDQKAVWQADRNPFDYEVELPEGAVRPMSESALRNMVIELKKAQMMDTRHALDMLDVPDSDEIADALEAELKLAAIAKAGAKR